MFNQSINIVILAGRLGDDPAVRYMQSGDPVANFSIATSEKWKDKNTGEKMERTEWHKVVVFGKRAEIIGQYYHKGDLIHVQGSLRTKKWTDKEGNDRYTTEIMLAQWGGDVQMIHSKGVANDSAPQQEASRPAAAAAASDDFDDDIPF